MTQFKGAYVARFYFDVPAEPGSADPDRHRHDDDHTDNELSDKRRGASQVAPNGGAMVADEITEGQIMVGTGSTGRGGRSHVASGSHDGADGRGVAREPRTVSTPLDVRTGGMHDPATLGAAGTGGPAYGRRDDMLSNPDTALGHRYVPVTVRRRQGLHFNRPGLRAIRALTRVTETDSPSPGGTLTSMVNPTARLTQGGGPALPRLRRLLRPTGASADDMTAVDAAPMLSARTNPGPIGDEWVR